MATLITGSPAVSRSPSWAAKGSSSVSFGGGFLFLSDSPEYVTTSALADNGCWLNRASVTGSGQVYLWHNNNTGSQIHSMLLIYNPNPFSITVTSTNHGTTVSTGNDSNAWASYFITSTISTTISAGGWGSMFPLSVPNNYDFGVVARTRVTNSSGSNAGAIFYDLAYLTDSSGASTFAASQPGARRGHGNSYYNTLNFATIAPTSSTNGTAYTIGAISDTFSGSDLIYITDDSGQTSGYEEGSYGQQLVVNLPIRNNTGAARSFHIFVGSTGGYSFPLVNMNGSTAQYGITNAFSYRDVIDTGTIAAGATTTVSFFLVVPSMSSTPYVIGARPV